MPQVQVVGEPSDGPGRPPRQQPAHVPRPLRVPLAPAGYRGEDHGGGGQGRHERRVAGVGGPGVVRHDAPADRRGPGPAAQQPQGSRTAHQVPGQQGEQRPDAELPDPRGSSEVRERYGVPGPVHRQRERGQGEGGGGQHHDEPYGPAPADRPGRAQHQHRQQRGPEQVELLLDGEGPEVQQRALVVPGGEVVGPLRHEPPVGEGQGRRDDVVLHVGAAQRYGQPGPGDGHRGEHHGGGGKQPPGPPGEEVTELDPAGGDRLPDQQAGDQVAGDDEEDVHADESAGRPGEAGMEGEYREDGDRAQTLDVGPEGGPVRARPGLMAGTGSGRQLSGPRGDAPAGPAPAGCDEEGHADGAFQLSQGSIGSTHPDASRPVSRRTAEAATVSGQRRGSTPPRERSAARTRARTGPAAGCSSATRSRISGTLIWHCTSR